MHGLEASEHFKNNPDYPENEHEKALELFEEGNYTDAHYAFARAYETATSPTEQGRILAHWAMITEAQETSETLFRYADQEERKLQLKLAIGRAAHSVLLLGNDPSVPDEEKISVSSLGATLSTMHEKLERLPFQVDPPLVIEKEPEIAKLNEDWHEKRRQENDYRLTAQQFAAPATSSHLAGPQPRQHEQPQLETERLTDAAA